MKSFKSYLLKLHILLAAALLAPLPAFARNEANAFVASSIQTEWAPTQFSNPAQHNPEKFRYIVHTIDTFGAKYSVRSSLNFVAKTIATNPYATLSTSVIDESRHAMFGTVGFILEVPAENVLVASPQDMGTTNLTLNRDPQKLTEAVSYHLSKNGPLPTPAELLSRTAPSEYNEVLVRGNRTNPVRVVGFVIVDIDSAFFGGPQRRDQLIAEIEQLSRKLKLPIVRLAPTEW